MTMIPKLFDSPKDCCACQACANVCPRGAITFTEDKYGFLFPSLNDALCVGCGRCERVCNFHNDTIELRRYPIKGYAAALNDKKIIISSASGGVFWAVAEWTIKKGGCVFGCVWDERMNPVHVCADTIDQLKPMQGSKYVQSDVRDAYQQAKTKLNEGRHVLFTGTPCQVAALRSYLGKNFDKLLTIDLICHGVPSNSFFHKYLTYLEKKYNGKVTDFHFRHKRPDWLNSCYWLKLRKRGKDVTKEILPLESPLFEMYSIKNQICRLSCSECKYSCIERTGDITIGDFWGWKNLDIKLPYQNGLSCILINDAKAIPIIQDVNLQLQEVSLDSIVKGHTQLRHSNYRDEKWEYVMENAVAGNFDKLMLEWEKKHFSIIRRCIYIKLLPPKMLSLIKRILKKC